MPRHLQKTMPRNLQLLTDSHNRIRGVGEGSEERGGDWRIEKRERERDGGSFTAFEQHNRTRQPSREPT